METWRDGSRDDDAASPLPSSLATFGAVPLAAAGVDGRGDFPIMGDVGSLAGEFSCADPMPCSKLMFGGRSELLSRTAESRGVVPVRDIAVGCLDRSRPRQAR